MAIDGYIYSYPVSGEIRKMMGNTKLVKAMQTIKLQSFLSGKTYPTVDVNNIGDIFSPNKQLRVCVK